MDAESVGGSGGGDEGETGNSAGSWGAGAGGVGGDDVEHGGGGAGGAVTHGAPFVVGARAQVPPPLPQLPTAASLEHGRHRARVRPARGEVWWVQALC